MPANEIVNCTQLPASPAKYSRPIQRFNFREFSLLKHYVNALECKRKLDANTCYASQVRAYNICAQNYIYYFM